MAEVAGMGQMVEVESMRSTNLHGLLQIQNGADLIVTRGRDKEAVLKIDKEKRLDLLCMYCFLIYFMYYSIRIHSHD